MPPCPPTSGVSAPMLTSISGCSNAVSSKSASYQDRIHKGDKLAWLSGPGAKPEWIFLPTQSFHRIFWRVYSVKPALDNHAKLRLYLLASMSANAKRTQ